MAADADAAVFVSANGPYKVRGGIGLSRTAQDETEYGEPVGYAEFEPITSDDAYDLCRCGRSAEKPFCDDACMREPIFDGTETADHGPRSTRILVFEGEGFVVTDDRSLCTDAGYCGDRFAHVWEMLGDSADPEVAEHIRTMVELCPSGRLAWADASGAAEHEPDYVKEIAIFRNGPIWLRGGVQVVGADDEPYEVRNRMLLCRCGSSGNKPFCDGSHKIVGFTDDATSPAKGERPGAMGDSSGP